MTKINARQSTSLTFKTTCWLGWLLLRLALVVLAFQNLGDARAQQSIQAPPLLEDDSLNPGPLGHLTFQGTNAVPKTLPTNTDVVIIGSSTYAVLIPTTNATLELSVTTAGTNGIELAVYSTQSLFTFIGADSSILDHTNVASVTFSAVAGVTYYIQLTGIGTITFNYGLGIAPAFTQTQSSLVVATGCPVTFGATATGIPAPTFQWQYQDTDIPGATNSTYTLAKASPSEAGNYRVKAMNDFGTAVSPEANLSVVSVNIGPPSIAADQSFQFTLSGLAGQTYAIEASTDLSNWTTVFSGIAGLDGSLAYSDSQATNMTLQFFRARAVCN
jgi:hypothetical protein